MPTIKKYHLISENGNETEFEVIKTTITKTVTKQRTDEDGYPISARENPESTTTVNEGIEALSLPSRHKAKVEILETQELMNVNKKVSNNQKTIKTKEFTDNQLGKNGRPEAINLTNLMNQEGKADPIPIPKNNDITWADES